MLKTNKLWLIIISVVVITTSSVVGFFLINKTVTKPVPPALITIPTKISTQAVVTLEEALAGKGKFLPQEKVVAEVGREKIYNRDLNYKLYRKYYSDFVSFNLSLDVLKRNVWDEVISDSILLQTAQKQGQVKLTANIFNNSQKDYEERARVIRELMDKKLHEEEKADGAMISVWYHNVKLPQIPLADAQKMAKEKITAVYNDIKSGKISFAQGGKRIQNDKELAKIDGTYFANAYTEFSNLAFNNTAFAYQEFNKALWKLNEGEISPIIQHPDENTPLGVKDEEFFGFVTISKKTNAGKGIYTDWLANEKKNYKITEYE